NVWQKGSGSVTDGGVYVFQDRAAFDAYRRSDLFNTVATHPNLANISARDFGVFEAPTRVTNGLLARVDSRTPNDSFVFKSAAPSAARLNLSFPTLVGVM